MCVHAFARVPASVRACVHACVRAYVMRLQYTIIIFDTC